MVSSRQVSFYSPLLYFLRPDCFSPRQRGSSRQLYRVCHQVMNPPFPSSHYDHSKVDDDQGIGGHQAWEKSALSIQKNGGRQEEREMGHFPGNELHDRPQECLAEADTLAS